jgi:hypothetical protein
VEVVEVQPNNRNRKQLALGFPAAKIIKTTTKKDAQDACLRANTMYTGSLDHPF